MPSVISTQNKRVRPWLCEMLGKSAANPDNNKMHCVTSLKIVRAKPGVISIEAHAWAKTRQAAARIQSLDRSDKGLPSLSF